MEYTKYPDEDLLIIKSGNESNIFRISELKKFLRSPEQAKLEMKSLSMRDRR